ncbi:hypothetical protein BZA05DRAFT_437609 [Tricharina praecox]|uniref:uncharacterized protein n=1 Tax=Tricharina praecox TaxID=43433 RepID=UPI00221FB459|nr:uncharacterized protein BZA05DRAFT_437609 [Tricharina praecox]KAI5848392.1 hypothetical protein BZA05DRAFT_437609 [Tricharina praecox]
MQSDIPTFLLDHILLHLPLHDLINARRVCKDWNATILSRQRLRRTLFLQPPTIDADLLRQPVAIHPVLQRLQSNWASTSEPIVLTRAPVERPFPNRQCVHAGGNFGSAPIEVDGPDGLGCPDEKDAEKDMEATKSGPTLKMATGVLLKDSPVKEQYATEPALTTFVIVLPTFQLLVVRPQGVRVWDVAMGVKRLFDKVSRERMDGFNSSCFATLNGFRQTNRMRHESLSRKFITLFRYDEEAESDEEGESDQGTVIDQIYKCNCTRTVTARSRARG